MEMKRVNAGKLRAMGYDARARQLRVELDDGNAIDYAGVSPDVWRKLSTSGSAWSYYRDNIEEDYTGKTSRVRRESDRKALEDLFRAPGEDA
ncbi:MAG: KTSC domain-containing protein [Burkholderiaceae bacterium]|nr:KTSC domain-containing protein [Burkholderiaceae bacterium]